VTAELWVVTYTIDFIGETLVTEFYRGDRDECFRIRAASCGGEHDQRKSVRWKPIVGLASEWDDLLRD
jgi:hypothetical protein